MEDDVSTLRRRLAALEGKLAEMSNQQVRLTRERWLGRGTLVLTLGVVVVIGKPLAAQNPGRVVAPFCVVSEKGEPIFRAAMGPDGIPTAYFYDTNGDISATIGGKPGKADVQGVPTIQIYKNGTYKGGLGISQTGNGLLELVGASPKGGLTLAGLDGLNLKNAGGNSVAQIGIDTHSQGVAIVRNGAGDEMAALSVTYNGASGRLTVSQKGAGITVLAGVKENGKGDVCANGAPNRQVCLSGLALKTFTPY